LKYMANREKIENFFRSCSNEGVSKKRKEVSKMKNERMSIEYHKWGKKNTLPEEIDEIDKAINKAMEKLGWNSCGCYHKAQDEPGTTLRGLDFAN